jgi:PPOX class probable F420-dependent enzyme
MPDLPAQIPEAYHDLLTGPYYAALTTLMPDGQPQTTVIWCDFDGEQVLITTMRGFRKEKNMRIDPRVTLLVYDLRHTSRYLEVRGRVSEIGEEGALAFLDHLSEVYVGRTPYFGEVVPAELEASEIPVLCKIAPLHVVAKDFR